MQIQLKTGEAVTVFEQRCDGEYYSDQNLPLRTVSESLKPVLEFARETTDAVAASLKPQKIEITFGAVAGAEGGFFGIAKAHGSASIEIKMTWEND
jgi:hypothetical protein